MIARDEARWRILRAANKFKLTILSPYPPVLYGMRNIERAVCVVRRNQLVDAATLTLAGYRATERS